MQRFRRVFEERSDHTAAGIVHQHVDGAEMLLRLSDHVAHDGFHRQIADVTDRVAAEFAHHRIDVGLNNVGDHQFHAVGVQAPRDDAADAAAGAGDDADLAVEAAHDVSGSIAPLDAKPGSGTAPQKSIDFSPGGKQSRLSRIQLGKLLHAEAVFERESVGVEEVQEHRLRRRMPPRTEHDRHLVLLHAIHRTADVVHVGDHEVDVVQPVLSGVAEPERVMQTDSESSA